MKIGGESVSDEIWKRKYWDYDEKVHLSTYTLTVTPELLTELAEGEGWQED